MISGRFTVALVLVTALMFVRPEFSCAACGGEITANSSETSISIVNCNTLTTVKANPAAYSTLSNLTVVIDGGSLLHTVVLDFSTNGATFLQSTVQNVVVRYQNLRITQSAPFPTSRTVVTLKSAFAVNVSVTVTNVVLVDPTVPLTKWLDVQVEQQLSIFSILLSDVTIDSVARETFIFLQSITAIGVRFAVVSSQVTLWSDTLDGKLAFFGHSKRSDVPRQWSYVDVIISDSNITTKCCTPHPTLPMPVMVDSCGPKMAEHRVFYFLMDGVYAYVTFVAMHSALSITSTNLSTVNVQSRVVEANTIGDLSISQLLGKINFTFINTSTTLIASQSAQMTNLHYFTEARNLVFALRGGRHVMYCTGNLSRTDDFRSSELFRFTNINDVYNLQVDVRDAVFELTAQAGIDEVVGTYDLTGVVGQLLNIGGNVSGGYISLSNISADIYCPNGLFSPNLNESASTRLTGITSGLAVVMVGKQLTLRNVTWTLATVSLRVTVGYGFVNPVDYITAGFIYNIVALAYIRASVVGGSMSIVDSHVVAWYQFDPMPLLVPKSFTMPFCTLVNGINATHLLAFTDDATLFNLCSALSSGPPQAQLSATNFNASIVNSTVAQPTAWSAPSDLLAVVALPSIMTNCHVHLDRCGSPPTVLAASPASGGDAVYVTPPAPASVACQACSAVFSSVTVTRSPGIAALLLTTLQAAQIQDSELRLNSSLVTAVSEFDGGPSLSRVVLVRYIMPSNSLTLQRVAITLYNATISSNVPFADRNLVTYRSSSIDLQCVNYLGEQVMTSSLLDAYLQNSSVSRVGLTRVLSDCNNRKIPASTPVPEATAVPPQTAVERAAAVTTSTTVVASGALMSALSVPTGFGTVPALQMSASVTRIASRLLSCIPSGETPPPSSSVTTSSDSGGDGNGDDGIGSQIADNPTRLHVGGRLGYAGGTVVGNLLLVVVGGVFIALVQHVCSVVRRVWSQASSGKQSSLNCAISRKDLYRRVIASAVPLYGVVVQPTAAAAVTLLVDHKHADAATTGAIALIVAGSPLAVAAVYLVVRFPLVNKLRVRRATEGRLFRFLTSGTYWATPPGNPNAPTLLRAKTILHLFHCLMEPYRAPYQWMFVVETGSAYLQGIVVGVAMQFAPDVPCPYIEGPLWALFAISVAVSLVMVVLRPTATPFDWVLSTVMNAWSAVITFVTLQREDELGTLLAMVQAIVSLVLLLIPVILAIAEVLGLAIQRASSTVEATLSGADGSHVNNGGGGILGIPWAADTLTDEELLAWHKQRSLPNAEESKSNTKKGKKSDDEIRKFQQLFELNPELMFNGSSSGANEAQQNLAGGAAPLSPDEACALHSGLLPQSGASSLLCRSSSSLLRAPVSPRTRHVKVPSVSLVSTRSASTSTDRRLAAATLKQLADLAATAAPRSNPSATLPPLSPTHRLVLLNDVVQLICDLARKP